MYAPPWAILKPLDCEVLEQFVERAAGLSRLIYQALMNGRCEVFDGLLFHSSASR